MGKKIEVGEKWMRWTLLEGVTKAAAKIIQKVVGVVSTSFAHSFFATLVSGIVRVAISAIALKRKGQSVFVERRLIVGAIGFGIGAVIATVLSFAVFIKGGDMGVNTFIMTLSIVPGAIADRLFFGHKLSGRGWCGVVTAILAGYVILEMPTLTEVLHSPLWVWLSVGAMLAVTVNQVITQRIKDIDTMVKNFWGGITEISLCAGALLFIAPSTFATGWSVGGGKVAIGAVLYGVIGVAMWSFNVLSYKGGAWIALKKLVMNASYLALAMFAGILFFHEAVRATKFVGVLLYLVAFVLMDDTTWKTLKALLRQRRV